MIFNRQKEGWWSIVIIPFGASQIFFYYKSEGTVLEKKNINKLNRSRFEWEKSPKEWEKKEEN